METLPFVPRQIHQNHLKYPKIVSFRKIWAHLVIVASASKPGTAAMWLFQTGNRRFHWVSVRGFLPIFPSNNSGTVSVRGFAEIFQLGPQLRGSAAAGRASWSKTGCTSSNTSVHGHTFAHVPQKLGHPNDFETRPVLVQKRGLHGTNVYINHIERNGYS